MTRMLASTASRYYNERLQRQNKYTLDTRRTEFDKISLVMAMLAYIIIDLRFCSQDTTLLRDQNYALGAGPLGIEVVRQYQPGYLGWED
jgi:hypothetical protein